MIVSFLRKNAGCKLTVLDDFYHLNKLSYSILINKKLLYYTYKRKRENVQKLLDNKT